MTRPILHRQSGSSGAHPSDRATRPTDQAPAGLGDTASVPCADWVAKADDLFARKDLTFAECSLAEEWEECLSGLQTETALLRGANAALVEALAVAREDVLCGRDYASDASKGALIYDTGERVSPSMTSEDVKRFTATITSIDAALARAGQ